MSTVIASTSSNGTIPIFRACATRTPHCFWLDRIISFLISKISSVAILTRANDVTFISAVVVVVVTVVIIDLLHTPKDYNAGGHSPQEQIRILLVSLAGSSKEHCTGCEEQNTSRKKRPLKRRIGACILQDVAYAILTSFAGLTSNGFC